MATAGLEPKAPVCDVGAGTGKLTLPLLERGLNVTAVEPNDIMRGWGIQVTSEHADVCWIEARAEDTGLPADAFQLVSFGSSFPTTDRPAALREAHRILRPGGWLALVSNHRDLEDPIQKAIEAVIHAAIPSYRYGPASESLSQLVDNLAETYARQLIPVTNLIHASRPSTLQHFADAFKIRKNKEDS